MDDYPDFDESLKFPKSLSSTIHIRVQQRNGRKCITTVQGIPESFDLKKILKYAKKAFSCNGSITEDDNGRVMQLQGDKRKDVQNFFVIENIFDKDEIKVHGF